jgi:small subunit ribosomal protein S27Ae
MAEAKTVKKKSHNSQLWKAYKVEGNSLVKLKKYSPKAGSGYFMAEHKDRRCCGKTGYMEKKTDKK